MLQTDLPAVLGGTPIRTRSRGRRPPIGQLELDYISAYLRGAQSWAPAEPTGGRPLADGATLDPQVHALLGGEPAALGAEFARIHAPGQSVGVAPCANGTVGLIVALTALAACADELGLRPHTPGATVIVPAITWPGTANAVLRRGLVPLIADVDPDTLCLTPDQVEPLLTDDVVGVIAVHPYARLAPAHALMDLLAHTGIFLVEDAAHATGARLAGRAAGTIGHAAMISLQGSKTLAAGTDGGLVLSRIPSVLAEAASIINCGRAPERRCHVSDNWRMPHVVAALARPQLTRFPSLNRARVQSAARLDEIARDLPGIHPLAGQPWADVPPTYQWPFECDLSDWGMSLAQIKATLDADLGTDLQRIYPPLNSAPASHYDPLSDPAVSLGPSLPMITRSVRAAPNALAAFHSTLTVVHAELVDDAFPEAFALAVRRAHAHRTRIAQELPT